MPYMFKGPDAQSSLHMIADMSEYLSGPALTGFVAWLDRMDAECDCGRTHEATPAGLVRSNLEILRGITRHASEVHGGDL